MITAAQLQAPLPNVVLVVADDAGSDAVSWMNWGYTPAITQTLDNLAASGAVFSNFYVHPLCSPTRASLLTGLHPIRTGAGNPIDSTDPWDLPPLDTLFQLFQRHGYATGMLGKWHLSARTDYWADPILRGAGFFKGTQGNIPDYYNWPGATGNAPFNFTEYNTQVLHAWGTEAFLTLPQPFFLWVAYNAPHEPYHVPPAGWYFTNPVDDRTKFLAALEGLDMSLSGLWAALPPGVQANTLWVILGDNGSPKEVNPAPPRQGKGTTGEGGVHTWMLWNWPSVAMRSSISELVTCTDLFTTFQDMLGDAAPRPADSTSFWSILSDTGTVRPYAYAEKRVPNGIGVTLIDHDVMVRDQRWKLRRALGKPDKLYDLSTAPIGQDGNPLQPPYDPDAHAALMRLVAEADRVFPY